MIELSALLPCNGILFETDDGDIVVTTVHPQQLVGIADNYVSNASAIEVTERIERVLAAVTDELEPVSEA